MFGFGKDDKNVRPAVEHYFTPEGHATVFNCGSMSNVVGLDGHDGIYYRLGNNTIVGPNGVSTVIGSGSVKTVFSPDGTHTVIENPWGGTVL